MRVISSLVTGLGATLLLAPYGLTQADTDEPVVSEVSLAAVDLAEVTDPVADAPVVEEAISEPIARPIDAMSRAAGVYGMYQGDVSDVREKPFSSTGDIETALVNLGGQDSAQLSKGWLAYSALVASQNEEFRAAVEDIAGFYGRDRVLLGLRNDYTYAGTLDGSDDALSAALTALDTDTNRINIAASYVKEQAYSLQASGWAKAKVGNKKGQLLESLGTGRNVDEELIAALASEEGDQALRQAGTKGAPSLWEGLQNAAQTIRFPTLNGGSFGGTETATELKARQDIAYRINTLAAYRLLGVEGESANELQTALADPSASRCLVKAQLNLRQCVAAVHQQHEVPFCISEHALAEVSDCMDVVVD